jgi:DNA invertase Pin-like site-specific DNA recombinase
MDYSTIHVSDSIDYICVYTRVSTRKQSGDEKHGLSSQKEICNDYINKCYSSNTNISYLEDVGSSYKSKLILNDMGKMIRKIKPRTLIIVTEVSRLGRNYKMVKSILKKISKKGARIVSICENLVYGQSRIKDKLFIKKVIDSEKESDVISMRVKNTQAYIKRNGGYIGKPPFGYKIIKNSRHIPILTENSEDFVLIEYIVDLTNQGFPYDTISKLMNGKGLLCKNKLWNNTKIKNILNKFYPEHMFLNISTKSKSLITISEDEIDQDEIDQDEISEDGISSDEIYNTCLVKQPRNLKSRVENTPYEYLTITISNDIEKERMISYSSSSNISSIKLRSGRIVNKF